MSFYKSLTVGLAMAALAMTKVGAQPISGVHDPLTLNPAWTLTDFHPTSWVPQLVDMAMLPDGRLAVLDMKVEAENTTGTPKPTGTLYIVGNLSAATNEGLTVETVATNLLEPTGIVAAAGKIYITEKIKITELTLNAPGTPATARKIADIPVDPLGLANFQEWAYGLLYKDGYLYTALGGGVRLGGLSWIADTTKIREPKRAGLLKVKIADGTSELIAGGFRAPNGLSWGPDGTSMWFTDNQGSFLPSCKLVKIQEGKNYGYVNGENKYRGMPETPPNVWYPHNEIAHSTSHPLFVKHGQFAGQVLIGDIAMGGISRTALETVDGQIQGSVHSFGGAFAVGIQKMIELDDGSIILGGLGKGDVQNWGWKGKIEGIQKMVAKAGVTNFEMFAVHAMKGGLEIQFTKPVGTGADVAASYLVNTAVMTPGPAYGEGNMLSRVPLAVGAVVLSDDKTRVFLPIAGITAKSVLSIKVTGVTSATGEALYRPAAWYTMNAVGTADFNKSTALFHGITAKAADVSAYDIKVRRLGRSLAVGVPFSGSHVLTLRTTQGRVLESHSGTGVSEYQLGAEGLAPGIYLLDVATHGQMLHKSVVF